jgi:altronate dehydratase small subunit
VGDLVYKQDITSIVMSNKDNVATLLIDLKEGETLTYVIDSQRDSITAKQSIPFGHKIAIKNIQKSEPVIKYGEVIGSAISTIYPGEHVHVHNIEGIRGRGDIAKGDQAR